MNVRIVLSRVILRDVLRCLENQGGLSSVHRFLKSAFVERFAERVGSSSIPSKSDESSATLMTRLVVMNLLVKKLGVAYEESGSSDTDADSENSGHDYCAVR